MKGEPKMNLHAIRLTLVGVLIWAYACSTGGGDGLGASASAAGGSAATGGSRGKGGAKSEPIEAGVLPDSALVWEAATPDSSLFHPLVSDNCDPSDPCCAAFEWPMAEPLPNIMMNEGAYVTQDGRLYQYIGTETVTWPLVGCAPKTASLYHCSQGRWWKDLDQDCPAP